MSQIWLLLKGTEQTAQAVPIIAQLFEEPGSSYIKSRLDHQSHDATQSAEIATKLTYRILRSEGYLTQSTVVCYRLEDAPENIIGHSGGLAFALTFATKALHRQHFKPVAATGILEDQGSVTRVEGFLEKLQTALATLPPDSQLLYPEGNTEDIDQTVHQQAKAGQIELIAVNNLEEALARVGIPLKKVYTYAPYRGLEAFQFQHAGTFFGRSNEVRSLCTQLDERAESSNPSILVLGASGSGKSSLVLAGVLPELVQGTTWHSNIQTLWSVFRPRDDQTLKNNPHSALPELEHLFQAVMASWRQALSLDSETEPQTWEAETLIAWLNDAVTNYPKTNIQQETRYVWVIDQLEELFTLGFQPDTICRFSEFLVELTQTGIRLILTLRSDYYFHYQSQSALLKHFRNKGTFDLFPIEGEAIEQVIREPAWVSDSQFERDAANVSLASRIQRDAGNQPGILPLLEFTLTELYQGRDKQQRLFTFQAYEAMGELKGSIGHRAEKLYQALDDASKKVIPSLIRSLSFIANEGKGIIARPVSLDNYPERTKKRVVIDRMTEARLLIKEGSENTPTLVRVAHEALLTHWERAKQQIERERRDLVLMQQLEEQSQRWQVTEEKNQTSFLLHAGLPLTEAVDLQERFEEDLPVEVRNYIQASHQAEQSRTAIENRQHKLRSRLRNLAMTLIIATLIFAGWQWQRADRQKNFAIARLLSSDSLTSLATKNANVFHKGALLAAESLRRTQTSQGTLAWEKFLEHLPLISTSISNQPLFHTVAFSPLGYSIATINRKGFVILTDPNTGKQLKMFDAKKAGMNEKQTNSMYYYAKIKYSPDGKLLASAIIKKGESLGSMIKLREVSSGELIIDLPQVNEISEMIFSPDGSRLAIAISGEIIMWDTATGKKVFSYRHMRNSSYEGLKLAYSSDGKLLAVSSFYDTRILDVLSGTEMIVIDFMGLKSLSWNSDGNLLALSNDDKTEVWNISTSKKQTEIQSNGWTDNEFIPNSILLVAGNRDQNSGLAVWDSLTGKRIVEIIVSGISGYAISPDGSLLVITLGGSDSEIQVINVANGKKLFNYFYKESVGAISFNYDGSRFATFGYVQGAKIWYFTESLFEYSAKNSLNDVVFTSDGRKVITALNKNVIIWDALSGNKINQISNSSEVTELTVSANDQLLLTWDKEKTVRTWSLDTGEELSSFNPKPQGGVEYHFFSSNRRYIGFDISHNGENGREHAYQFWDVLTGKQVSRIPKDGWSTQHKMRSSNNNRIVSFDKEFIHVWDIDNLREIKRMNNLVTHDNYTISPNGNYFVFSEQKNKPAELWSLVKGRKIAALINKQQSQSYPMLFQFSSDERLVSFIDEQASPIDEGEDINSLNLHKTSNGEQIFRFTPKNSKGGSDQLIRNVLFSPNNQYIAAVLSSFDTMSGSILVWDASDGQQLGQFGLPGKYLSGYLEFSPNSQYLAHSGDKGIRIWDIEANIPLFASINYRGPIAFGPNGRWLVAYNKKSENGVSTKRLLLWQQKDIIEKLCERIDRNFSEQEWQQFLMDEPYRATCPDLPIPDE